jgi:hypothetical protein
MCSSALGSRRSGSSVTSANQVLLSTDEGQR